MAILKRIALGAPVTAGAPLTRRDILLSNTNRIGYGAAAAAGENEVTVSNLTALAAAMQTNNNYIILSSDFTGQTVEINTTIETNANKLAIDGSLAPGVLFKVGPTLATGRGLMWFTGDDIILHNIATSGLAYPSPGTNRGAFRFFGNRIWISKCSATKFDDDFINLIGGVDNITCSDLKATQTHKAIFTFNTSNPETKLTIVNCELASNNRKPWVSAGFCHSLNNYIHSGDDATRGGRKTNQLNTNFQYNGDGEEALIISERNDFDNIANGAIKVSTDADVIIGKVQSVNDKLNGNTFDNNANVTFASTPSLFPIPYAYTAMNEDLVRAHVLANAGAN